MYYLIINVATLKQSLNVRDVSMHPNSRNTSNSNRFLKLGTIIQTRKSRINSQGNIPFRNSILYVDNVSCSLLLQFQ